MVSILRLIESSATYRSNCSASDYLFASVRQNTNTATIERRMPPNRVSATIERRMPPDRVSATILQAQDNCPI
jgi:hypothetical protein